MSYHCWAWIVLAGILAAAVVALLAIRMRSRMRSANSRLVAQGIIAERLSVLRRVSYSDLLQRSTETPCDTVIGLDGGEYQVETEVCWNEPHLKAGNLRVMVSVDGGSVSAFKPLLGTFIMAPDGSFVGEG